MGGDENLATEPMGGPWITGGWVLEGNFLKRVVTKTLSPTPLLLVL